MQYTPDQIAQVAQTMEEWLGREETLLTNLMVFPYHSGTAREFMNHGLGRRLRLLQHCIEQVFRAVPMSACEPDNNALLDATAFLQTFLINAFGAIDNMAHVWCQEADLRDDRDRPIPRAWIGFRSQNRLVRASLSENFRAYLAGTEAWFGYLEDYRHALAHRIPLYIPPRALDPVAQTEHARLQTLMDEALINNRDRERYFALLVEQNRLGEFVPWMMHSYGEAALPVRFHPQIACDFATVVEIGEYLLLDLQTLHR